MAEYVVANWKAYKNRSQAEEWITAFLQLYRDTPGLKVILAPPFPYLDLLAEEIDRSGAGNLHLAVQDISPFPAGAYTGSVAADMVKDQVGYALIGHSERRRYFHETNQEIANKVQEAMDAGIRPILCLDRDYARAQIAALDEIDPDQLIVGYGPVGAIGLDVPQDLDEAKAAIKEIAGMLPSAPVLYGGSIREGNAADYMTIQGLSGLMVSSGCLNPQEFAAICRTVSGN